MATSRSGLRGAQHLYLFGQYLGWVEIIRRESQYVDPRSRKNNRLIVEKLEHVRDCIAESARTRPGAAPVPWGAARSAS